MGHNYQPTLYKMNCRNCGKEFKGRKNQIYCSQQCCNAKHPKSVIKSGLSHLSTPTIGAIAELMVSNDLMRKGYDVYRALSPAAHADIVAIKDGEIIQYEIRSGTYYTPAKGGKKLLFPTERIKGKSLVVVTHSDGVIHYLDDAKNEML